MTVWNRDSMFLSALIVLFALLVLLHVFFWLRSLRDRDVPKLLRWFTFLPPLGTVASFWSGARVLPVLWCIVLIAYLVLRSLA
jgi:uncharacterized membrane protein